jgi:transposase-like protein
VSNPKCPSCKAKMKKNKATKAGTQRWRCSGYGASFVRRHDKAAK